MTSTTTTTNAVVTNHSEGVNDSSNGNSNGSSIEAEYNKIPDRIGWQRLYQEIHEKCEREANEKHFGVSESKKSQNRCLNRYRDVNPYDHSRIIIHRGNVDYINANLVKLERAERKYILTQGPLGDTVGHFWLMVWEQKTKAILMLNKLLEKRQVKCHLYWPEEQGTENALKLDEVNLNVEYMRCEVYKNFCRRWFKLTDLESNESREIIQFHYTTWPDFGIPSSPVAFLQFLKQVRGSGALDPDVGPAVVHCSAGIGRSGTFCLVDCCLVLIDKLGEDNVSVQDVLSELRRYRMGLIQTADQLYFSYQAIIEGIKLLKDPSFLNYKEAPIINNDEKRHEQINSDETPPPLPPRTHSLLPLNVVSGVPSTGGPLSLNLQTKPLPKTPASENANDEQLLYANDKHKDALNNFINNEKHGDNMSNRPLPPLPAQTNQQNSLDRVHESESDEHDNESDEDSNHDNYQQLSNINGNGISSAATHDNSVGQSNNIAATATTTATNTAKDAAETHDLKKLNGIEAHINSSSNNTNTPENELKRRKRMERQAKIEQMEQKLKDIKRRRHEAEENKETAKKRRSLVTYIAAGAILGVICVYAYVKWS